MSKKNEKMIENMASFWVNVKRIGEKKVWGNEEKCEIAEMYKWRYIEKDGVGEYRNDNGK